MGWKALKEKYNIQHQIQMTDKGLAIGSGFVHNLIVINPETGAIRENETFKGLGREQYSKLMDADPTEIVRTLEEQDTFERSIPIYTYEDSQVLKKYCEVPEYPNTTHDGCLIYENTFSTDRDQIVQRAIENAEAGVSLMQGSVQKHAADLLESKQLLAERKKILMELTGRELREDADDDEFVELYDQLTRQRDRLAAHVQRFRQIMSELSAELEDCDGDPIPDSLWRLHRDTPDISLTSIKAAAVKEALAQVPVGPEANTVKRADLEAIADQWCQGDDRD